MMLNLIVDPLPARQTMTLVISQPRGKSVARNGRRPNTGKFSITLM
jgi:hypothetical protein